jgi:anaerobic magnesium-protoporphyrin IX monomethyl ester cyclase
MRELDRLSFPAWDLVDLERYRRTWNERHGYHSINMVTTRGCPYRCNWCAKPIWGQRYHSRSPEDVVREMVFLRELIHPDHIWFVDDIFGLKRGWIEKFSELVLEHDVRTPFKCLLRTDLVTESLATALAAAACEMVWLGAESGAQKVLDAMEKGTTVEDTYRATRLLRGVGIKVAYFLQFGYPGENWEEIQQTFKMVRDNMPDDIGVSVTYPLPGTRFYETVTLGRPRNWIDSDDLALLFKGRFSPQFYRVLHKALHEEYRARKVLREWKRGRWVSPLPVLRLGSLVFDRLTLRRLRFER